MQRGFLLIVAKDTIARVSLLGWLSGLSVRVLSDCGGVVGNSYELCWV